MWSCSGKRFPLLRVLPWIAAALFLGSGALLLREFEEQAGALRQMQLDVAALRRRVRRTSPRASEPETGGATVPTRERPGATAATRRLETFVHVSSHSNPASGAGCVTVLLDVAPVSLNMTGTPCGGMTVICPPCFIIEAAPEPAFTAINTLTVEGCSTMNLGMNTSFKDAGPFQQAAALYHFTNADPSRKVVIVDGIGARIVLDEGSSLSAICWTNGVRDKLLFMDRPQDTSAEDVVSPTFQLVPGSLSPFGYERYRSVVVDLRGRIFAAPYQASFLLMVTPSTPTSLVTVAISAVGSQLYKYGAMALGFNGKMYAAPAYMSKVLEISSDGTSQEVGSVLTTTYGERYLAMVVAADGKIYAAPYDADKVLVITTQGNSVSATTMGATVALGIFSKYKAMAAALNGKVYAAPYGAAKVLEIDPSQSSVGEFTETYLGVTSKYQTLVAAPNGKLYAAPLDAAYVLEINPAAGTSRQLSEDYGPWPGFSALAVGVNGRLYAPPGRTPFVLEIDPVNGTSRLLGDQIGSQVAGTMMVLYASIAAAANGKLYAPPSWADKILEIDPVSGSSRELAATMSGSGSSGQYSAVVAAANGKLYAIPDGASQVLEISPGIR
mmetsp:Transcript_761/g.2565  ORF Transcript_761/g.2565 Transcript_761/m.2565 type:complete len:612 (+) Transcript_761:139-1974(+)